MFHIRFETQRRRWGIRGISANFIIVDDEVPADTREALAYAEAVFSQRVPRPMFSTPPSANNPFAELWRASLQQR